MSVKKVDDWINLFYRYSANYLINDGHYMIATPVAYT